MHISFMITIDYKHTFFNLLNIHFDLLNHILLDYGKKKYAPFYLE